MLNVEFIIERIDYEKSFIHLFPLLMKRCRQMEEKNFVVRLLLRIGSETQNAALGILNHLDEQTKNEIICHFFAAYTPEIVSEINAALKKEEIGKFVQIKDIVLIQQKEALYLSIRQIEINSGVMKVPAVKEKINETAREHIGNLFGFGKWIANHADSFSTLAVSVAPESVQKFIVNYFSKEAVKGKMLMMVENIVREKGLFLELRDMELHNNEEETDVIVVSDTEGTLQKLPDAWEDKLIDAIADYLKSIL